MNVILYGTRRCTHCRRLKQWLRAHHVHFIEYDIERNLRAFKAFQKLGGRGVPLLVWGKQRIHGFDEKRLKRMYRQLEQSHKKA